MSDIKFNCPQCGQHLTADATSAGATVACPKCGLPIMVPQLARMAAISPPGEAPARSPWGWIAAAIVAVVLLCGSALVWQMHRQAALTPEKLSGKQFYFTTLTTGGNWYEGFIQLQSDGKLNGSGVHNPNETFWAIDPQGRLIFKHQDGRISTIFTSAHRQDGKWHFSGPFQFAQAVTNSLEEAGPEIIANEKWIDPLNAALYALRNNHDPDSANFVSNVLASAEKPGGLPPEVLADDRDRINDKVRELVQRGAMESAAILQNALNTAPRPEGPAGPPHPSHKTGGKPGPGGLVLYLPFDKPADADGTVHDESGAGNDGKVFGAQWVANGKFGGAYRFRIANLTDRIVIPNSDTLNPDTITIAAWIRTAEKDGFWSRIVDKDYRNGYCFDLSGDWHGKGARGKPGLETSQGFFYNNRQVTDNRWHHLAVTFDGKNIACYIDGVEQSRAVRHSGPLKKDDWDLCIGNSAVDYGTGEFLAYDGLIDEVRIYNRALSPDEVKALAQATRAGVDVISPEGQARTRRLNALGGALRSLANSDPVSANLVSNILASFDQPGGQSTNALATDIEQMKKRVRDLVLEGNMTEAGVLNGAQSWAFYSMDFPAGPAAPNHKTGGMAGPGGLVLYFPFDVPDTNGIVHDESGAGNDGQVFGAKWEPDGKFGGAYRFSITNFDDRIVVPNSDTLNPDYITIAAWIKATGAHTGLWERILDKDFHHGYALSLAGDRNRTGKLALESPNFGGLTSRSALDDNLWHHVAVTYDGQTVRCYIDGVENNRRQRTTGPLSKCDWDLCIGNSVVDYGWGELLAFDGLIDEVRIYNRALSADEIKLLASATQAGVDVLTSPAKTDPAERLKKLKALYEQGLINKDDYDRKVKEIMDSL